MGECQARNPFEFILRILINIHELFHLQGAQDPRQGHSVVRQGDRPGESEVRGYVSA